MIQDGNLYVSQENSQIDRHVRGGMKNQISFQFCGCKEDLPVHELPVTAVQNTTRYKYEVGIILRHWGKLLNTLLTSC